MVQERTMSGNQDALGEAFITQQRTRLEALRRQLLGGEEDTDRKSVV